MAEKQDWVIARPVQDSLSSFAAQQWKIKDIQTQIDERKIEAETVDDALAEFDLEGSYLKLGEAYQLITDYGSAAALLEEKQKITEAQLSDLKDQLAAAEALAASRKTVIEAALGDRVRLNF